MIMLFHLQKKTYTYCKQTALQHERINSCANFQSAIIYLSLWIEWMHLFSLRWGENSKLHSYCGDTTVSHCLKSDFICMNLCNWLSQRAVVFVGGWLLQSAYKWAFRETLPGCYCSNHLEAWISVFKVGQIFDLEILMNKAKCSRIKYLKAFTPKAPNSPLHNMMISFFGDCRLGKSVCCVYLWNEHETLWTVLSKYAAQAIFWGQNLKCIVSLKV